MTENTKNEITTFVNEEFGEVRTTVIDNEMWFLGKDICDKFGDKNHIRSIGRIDEDDKKTIEIIDSLGRKQNATFINESGFYALLFSMQPQKAHNGGVSNEYPISIQKRIEALRRFKHWVTSDVIPSIRKTGGYVAEGYEQNFLSELVKRLDERDKVQHESIMALQKQVVGLQKILDVKPDMYKINTWKKHTGTPAVERLASALGMSKVEKSLYGDIYEEMNTNCGFNRVTAVMDYRAKYHLDEEVEIPPINAIADNPDYQRDFVLIINRMIAKVKPIHTEPTSVSTTLDKFDTIIHPLIELRKDKTAHGANTLGLVYDRMHSKQSWAVLKGKNKCSNKKQLIMKKDSEYDLFCKIVNEMIKEFE